MKFKLGFTLSEALIAMVILGVVAGLTVPSVMNNFQKGTRLAMLKKVYLELEHNMTLLQSEKYYKSTLVKSLLYIHPEQFVSKYYKTTKDCGQSFTPCFASKYSSINGDIENIAETELSVAFTMENGVSMAFTLFLDGTVVVFVDVNGAEGPNVGGKDMFTMIIFSDFTIDDFSLVNFGLFDGKKNPDASRANAIAECKSSASGMGCLSSIIDNNWKIKYY